MSQPEHILVVDEDGEMEVEHPDCPLVIEDGYRSYECGVDFEESNCGIDSFFELVGAEDPWMYAQKVIPGRYQIEHWETRTTHWEYGPEYDAGLALVYFEEAQP